MLGPLQEIPALSFTSSNNELVEKIENNVNKERMMITAEAEKPETTEEEITNQETAPEAAPEEPEVAPAQATTLSADDKLWMTGATFVALMQRVRKLSIEEGEEIQAILQNMLRENKNGVK